MEFKDLNLAQEQIEDALIESIKAIDINAEHSLKNSTEAKSHYLLNINNKEAQILFHYKGKGTTTIQHKIGKNPDISLAVATSVKAITEIDPRKNFSITVKIEKIDEGLCLIDYLKEDCGAKELEKVQGDCYVLYKIQGQYHDKLTIKIYDNKSLQIQGKPIGLYKEVFFFLSELLDEAELLNAQAQYYKCDLKLESGYDEFSSRFSYSEAFLGDKLRTIITPSLIITKIDISLPDYTLFVFPALKGLEGYIKLLFLQIGKKIESAEGFGIYFQGGQKHKAVLTSEAKGIINSEPICMAIEKSYNYFRGHRHTLFHVSGMIEETRIINSKENAENIINDVIDIINETYALVDKSLN